MAVARKSSRERPGLVASSASPDALAMRFRMGHILRDYDLMEKARDLSIAVVAEDLTTAESTAHALLGIPVPAATSRD